MLSVWTSLKSYGVVKNKTWSLSFSKLSSELWFCDFIQKQDSPIHKFLFWVAISVLQLDEVSLYAAGLSLLEQNLHTLDNMGILETEVGCLSLFSIYTHFNTLKKKAYENMVGKGEFA